ncbi:hypothetical protein ACLB1T_15310 [Escherichia coli]
MNGIKCISDCAKVKKGSRQCSAIIIYQRTVPLQNHINKNAYTLTFNSNKPFDVKYCIKCLHRF